jgi:starch synthase
MKVLSVASEFYPLIKTGGLADVAGALPGAMASADIEMRTLLPGYAPVMEQLSRTAILARFDDLFGGRATLRETEYGSNATPLLVLDAPHLYDRPGNPYLGPGGRDWPDNHLRFAALSWVGSRIALGLLGDWRPDVVHGHDWQAALTPVYLSEEASRPATVLTIHNLAFQGIFAADQFARLRLPWSSFTIDGLEYYGKISFLKGGLTYSDHLTTVSPTYAREICTPEQGMGLDGVLRQRRAHLTGITNGIDDEVWNPGSDIFIASPYGARAPEGKAANKAALQEHFGLAADPDALLFCVISRLTAQKGLDLLIEALPTILANGGQLAVLGSGESGLQSAFLAAAQAYPSRIGVVVGYDEPLSHQMQAGADAIIVPSRFEPCGLTQLYGLRYGTLPVVARVGGLADTVIDANQAALLDGVATGFQFDPGSVAALVTALERAFALYANQPAWQAAQQRAMTRKVDWSVPAKAYAALYRDLVEARPTRFYAEGAEQPVEASPVVEREGSADGEVDDEEPARGASPVAAGEDDRPSTVSAEGPSDPLPPLREGSSVPSPLAKEG